MKNILVIGAGKSAIYLLEYLRDHAAPENWQLTICDQEIAHLTADFGANPHCQLLQGSAADGFFIQPLIAASDIVISMVPAFMHIDIAKICLEEGKNLITPSYVSEALNAMNKEVEAKGLLFLNEMGVDPGIDHMSAMRIIHAIQAKGGVITGFESYCGGLIAPANDDNPWHYKFTWNPRNVVLAGQGTAKFLQDGVFKYTPYQQLFQRTDTFQIEGYGDFEGYANRDSLKYISLYGLHDVKTMYRGTFRRPPFCAAWDVFVQLGLCDDTYEMEAAQALTHADLLRAFIPSSSKDLKADFLGILKKQEKETLLSLFEWLELFDDKQVFPFQNASPAKHLQYILERKLVLMPGDKDLLVMLHKFHYTLNGKNMELISSLAVEGEDEIHTAMAKTVGLPIAIATKFILQGKMPYKGVLIPLQAAIYEPILDELAQYNIKFLERETSL